MLTDSENTIIVERNIQTDLEPTSALLNYCKNKFLKPYNFILSIVALQSISTDSSRLKVYLNYCYSMLIVALLISGYVLKYFTSDSFGALFHQSSNCAMSGLQALMPRGDLLSPSGSNEGGIAYICASILDIGGFMAAILVCKCMDRERFQQLCERVFLINNWPKQLCRRLWIFIGFCLILATGLYIHDLHTFLLRNECSHWYHNLQYQYQILIKIILWKSLFVQNFIKVLIVSGYCIECYLLRTHLLTLGNKFIINTMDTLNWMREIIEFRKLIDHLNRYVAIPVGLFIIVIGAYTFAGILDLKRSYLSSGQIFQADEDNSSKNQQYLIGWHLTKLIVWLVLGLLPFIMAASLSHVCQSMRTKGHQIRVRPRVYQNSSSEDLNSMLLFVSSLEMNAQLFLIPIRYNYLCALTLIVFISMLAAAIFYSRTFHLWFGLI